MTRGSVEYETPHFFHVKSLSLFFFLCPQEGHIVFDADPVGIASCLHSIFRTIGDSDQTCTDTLLGQGKEVIRFW